ncbi:MAG TPA: hypothetical protein VL241_04010 [Gemmatimonadales bacterium]|nr:hypothetical protein [Gemmatimonadales bacterium]
MRTICLAAAAALLAAPLAAQAPKPEAAFAGLIKSYLGMGLPAGWDALEKLPGTKWAALPPQSLTNCLPDGGCFTRQGQLALAGRPVTLIATGARTMVLNLYFRNSAAPLGEAAVLAALQDAGLTAELARCPAKPGAVGTSWYRLKGAKLSNGFLSIQPPVQSRPTEGFVLSYGDELPRLQPNQLALYSEQCAPGAERKVVSTSKPHELLAGLVVTLLAPTTGPALYDFAALKALPTEVTWLSGTTGSVTLAGRTFSVSVVGSATQVKAITLEEQGQHPRGEHMLGVVYQKGIQVRLVRCGPVYSGSTNNWYSLMSTGTRTAMIRQSISYDGNNVADSYEIRLDGTLPARDPRDRDPGVNSCQ